jgi:hypothetical protein
LRIRVECYAGWQAEETPRAIVLGEGEGRRLRVAEVLDRWLAPDHRYFKVRCEDGTTYMLRHDPVADRWELVQMDASEA